MNITQLDTLPKITAQPAANARQDEVATHFDVIFYKLLLQSTNLMSGMSGTKAGTHSPEQGILSEMMTDFFAQQAARQQSTFGMLVFNTTFNTTHTSDGVGK